MQMDSDTIDSASDNAELELTYTGVFVHSKEHIIVPTVIDEYVDDRRDHALVQHWIKDDWVQHLIDESICGVCATGSDPTIVFNVGVGGHVVIARIPGGESEEEVDSSSRGPNYSELLRCVKIIEGVLHVAGMARQVYRRDHSGSWSAIDAGVYQPRGTRNVATGFLDLDGFSLSEIYAAGYKGEIWLYNGASWTQQASPTNLALTQVLAASSGFVYIAGLAGTLIRGRENSWMLVAEGQIVDDFWGLTEFRGQVYVASKRGLYRIDDDTLTSVHFGEFEDITTSYLHASDDILVSVGEKDIMRTYDGINWDPMPKP